MTNNFSIVNMNACVNNQHAVFSVKADSKLLKMVWECSDLKVSRWKILHPSDTEDKHTVGLTSENEAEGLEAAPRTLWKGHMVGTNGSVDQQEVSFQNICTWLLLPKNTQCGVH